MSQESVNANEKPDREDDLIMLKCPRPLASPKLFGRAFYESLGSPKLVLAPMVDQSEFVRLFKDSL